MVQVLAAAQRKPSFGERLSAGVGRGLEVGQQLMDQHKQQEQLENARTRLSQLTGFDLTGFSPEMLDEVGKQYFHGQNQMALEELKQQGKSGLMQEKQDFLSRLFGGSQQSSKSIAQDNENLQGNYNPAEISDADIAQATAMDPTLGRELRAAKDAAVKERRFEREFEEKKRLTSPEHRREQQIESSQAQADVKYNQTLQEASKQHELKEQTLNRLDALNKKGVTGKPYEKLLEKFGLVALTSEGRREFAADVKNLITDIRSILGAQFTGFEFQTILNAYPSPDFSKEANTAIIKNLKDFQDIKKKEVEFADKLKKENKGKIPFDFQSQVNEKVREYASTKLADIKENTKKIMNEEYGISSGNVLMFDPNGEPLNVPPDQVDYYESIGAVIP